MGLFGRERFAPGQEPHWCGDVKMRRAEVRMCLACVEMLARRVAETHFHGHRPVEEVGRGGATDGAEPREAAASPGAQVEGVALFALGPERDVLRIEGAPCD